MFLRLKRRGCVARFHKLRIRDDDDDDDCPEAVASS